MKQGLKNDKSQTNEHPEETSCKEEEEEGT
jgi:hypothetical protein